MKRRDFLIRSVKAGLTIFAAGGLAGFFHDRLGPQHAKVATFAGVRLADFSIPGLSPRLGIAP